MKNGFEDLEVWKKSHELTLEIYRLTNEFPKEERFRLIDQLCRSASSIPANIAEGKGRYHKNEFKHFLYVARGSLEETKYHLILAKDLGYIENEKFNELIKLIQQTGKMLNGLIKSL
ncbi:four helix bundle protein [Caminicella sporogenes DSM 14501]|uniref:Four helix bundle protein n=1 Tax=Caminicella sporogenes DSM 14501 TaxID=1121266 RepID=A0A1M6PVJ9_9FIRM|nr:four helix bundle protein [Caminicella sporogenes]RKD21955.1 four helix bundle protein [Caminicella sporogenes]SHK11917.1 four helix bundle protein [Caminicella sporogenes DSM 14501]